MFILVALSFHLKILTTYKKINVFIKKYINKKDKFDKNIIFSIKFKSFKIL